MLYAAKKHCLNSISDSWGSVMAVVDPADLALQAPDAIPVARAVKVEVIPLFATVSLPVVAVKAAADAAMNL